MGIIYKATNLINGKYYVGQTLYSLTRRRSIHINYALKRKDKMIFHSAIRKYGDDNFEWKVLERCKTKDFLNKREKYYIKKLNTSIPNGYNLNNGGSSVAGFGQPEHFKKITSERMKKNNPNFKHGKYINIKNRIFHCIEPNCNNIISSFSALRGNGRCKSCAQKGERNSAKNLEVRKKLSRKWKGSNNPRAKTYLIIYPNKESKVIKCLRGFCRDNNITEYILRNNKNGWRLKTI